ncbi:MAG TPA: gluconate 2-dehydrogenase subunit 3 family protein [Bryobacteraceae bacterium]|jgi:hypothetical protein|nr:gluconate 2-dehydrogenase subunit 3 family protein [Bryobacteraceae bacterium]
MNRRALLKALAAWPAVAGTLARAAAPPPGSIANVPTVTTDGVAQPRVGFFNASQFGALTHASNLIYPPFREYPGALECGVPAFLDFLLSESPADRQTLYRDGLDQLNSRGGKPFGELTAAEADAVLAPLHQPWTYEAPSDPFAHFLRELKDDVQTATENSQPWLAVESRLNGHPEGIGNYWREVN